MSQRNPSAVSSAKRSATAAGSATRAPGAPPRRSRVLKEGRRIVHDLANALGAVRLQMMGVRMAETDSLRTESLDEAECAVAEGVAALERLAGFMEALEAFLPAPPARAGTPREPKPRSPRPRRPRGHA